MKNIKRLLSMVAVVATISITPIIGVYAETVGAQPQTTTQSTHAAGWSQENGTWYYYNADGTHKTGWFQDGGNWYYCYASLHGAMASNCYVGTYKLNASGAWEQNAPTPASRQGKFGTEYLEERSSSVYSDSSFTNQCYTVALRVIDEMIAQGKVAQGTYTNSNIGQTTGWYLK